MENTTEARLINAVYAECSGLPSALSANVTDQQLLTTGQRVYTVTAEWSQTDLVRGSRLRYSQQWTVMTPHSTDHQTTAITAVLAPSPCIPVQGELLSRYSPVRALRAVVRETAGHQLLEIWDSQGLTKCLDLTALGKHGRVYDDAQFGGLAWSDCETRLLYVAEKNRVSSESTGGKDRSVYSEDWGEGLTSRSVPVVCVVELVTGTLSILQGIPPHVSPGQALWAPDSQSVVLVGWWHEPFRLGLKFCSNRRSALFRVHLDGHCECLSGDNMSVSCPRLSPDRTCLVYLQGSVFGPHNQCLSLQLLDLGTRETSTLLDVADRAALVRGSGGFAGVYEALPTCCWSTDSQRVVFSSAKRNRKDLFVFDRKAKTLTILSDTPVSEPPPPPPPPPLYNLPPPPPPLPQLHLQRRHRQDVEGHSAVYGSWKLLTLQKDMMVVSCSSPNTPPTLRVGFLPSNSFDTVNWTILQQPVTFDLSWTLLDVTPTPEEDNIHYSGLDFGAVLAKPRHLLPGAKIPLVVFIHGGPHSQFPAEWNATTAGLAKLGFAVLMVNYRGSTGFGQDSILSLIGRIGNQDVKDVHRAVHTALQGDATLDPDRLAVIGGSHGGFLSCHLVGQYPDFYRACVARNPVINAATLLGTSDIVDWRYSCVGIQYSYDQIPTAEALAAMLEKSPITHAAQIRVPVLLLLGGKDKRVSPHQGVELYRALKSRDSPVRVLWFPEDGHSLARVDTQAECFLNTVLWLQQHL